MADTKKKSTTKYKFGQKELDMQDYIENIGYNVQNYLEDRRKNRGWTDEQVQEFSTAYNRLMGAFKQQLADGSNRFSTNDLGVITDSQGEFSNIDNDNIDPVGSQYYYNDKGERITTDDYNLLKDKKKKKYKTFNANRQVAEYFRIIGNKLQDAPKPETSKFNLDKHGFVAWWNKKYNPAGGEVNLAPFLDKDPVGTDGKRPVSNRARMAAGWMNEYLDWLKDQDLDYSNYDQFKDYDTYSAKGRALAQKWNDGIWNADDLIAGQAFGISNDFSNGFFTQDEKPYLTDQQREDIAAEKKAKEEEQKQKDIIKAKQKWIADQKAIFTRSNPIFTYENPFSQVGMDSNHWYNADGTLNTENYYSAWGREFLNPDGGINPIKLQNYIDQYVQNPFSTKYAGTHARNIVGLINSGIAQQISSGDYQGMYYIPSKSDEVKNRALIYDPNTKKMFYAFIGYIPQIWDKRTNKYKIDHGLIDPDEQLMFKEGGIISMQTGGDFGNTFVQDRNKAVETAATNAGTSARKFLNDRRKIAKKANAFDNNNGGLTEADYYHIAGLAGDVGSIIGSFSGAATMGIGSIVGAGVGAAGTTSHLIGDIKEDGFQWSDVGRAAVGYGLDLIGLLPGAGVTKLGKISNGILKIAPKLAAIVAGSATVMNAGPILKSLKKATTDTSNMTIDDWRNVSQALMLALGGARAVAGNRTFNKVRPKTGDVAIDLKNTKTGEIETRKFSGETAKKLQEAKSNKDIIAILKKENPALGEYELAASTSWIPKPQWIRKNGFIGNGWQYPVRFDSKRVRPMAVRIDKRAGNIEYATPQSPLKTARTELVTRTKEEVNEDIVKSKMDKLKATSDKYEKALNQKSNKLNAAKVRKAEIDKIITDKKFTSKDTYETFKGRGEKLKDGRHDKLIDRIIAKKYGTTEEGAPKQQKYYKNLIKKLEELKTDGHTKAYQDLAGKKNAEGIIEFTTPGGETIQRDFAKLIQRYLIKHEKGGKFSVVRKYKLGDPITNVKGKAKWFEDMYSHQSMQNWIKTWNIDNYKDFNKLQDSWWNNLKNTKYDPNDPKQARGSGIGQSMDVLNRQKEWDKTGTNAAIEDAVKANKLIRNGGTNDNLQGHYQDGYFGAQEYLRHGGNADSWFRHENELNKLKEFFKNRNLDYYQDEDTGMYKLRPLNSNGSSDLSPESDGSQQQDNQVNQKGQFDQVRKFNIDPMIYSIAHNSYANAVNDRMTANQIDAMRRGLTLYDPKNNTKYLEGDFDALMSGQQAAGQLMHLASQPLISDGNTQTSAYTDSVIKALDYIRQDNAIHNQALKKSKDEIWKLRYDDDTFNYDVAMKNRQSIDDLIENIANVENAHDAKEFTNNDVLWQEMMYPIKQRANKIEALEEEYALSDIKNDVKYNLSDYAKQSGTPLSKDEEEAWQTVISGDKTYSELGGEDKEAQKRLQKAYINALRKASEIEQNKTREYYGIVPGKYMASRQIAVENKLDDFANFRLKPKVKEGGTLTLKDGSKITIAKIRERSKDADRFHKTIKDKQDRIDKAIARLDKKMYKRRDPEKRRK